MHRPEYRMKLGVLFLLFGVACSNPATATATATRSAAPDEDSSPPAARWIPAGAEPLEPGLQKAIDRVLLSRGPGYRPRTRHLRPDGSPVYANRLLFESSPYLRQHAHNPVDWFPWGDEAFERARTLGRPILLSIGYSTCHWCHVMEEESFEDEEIAAFLNANYVAIKVDREERPDLDAIYMSAVQMMTGRGGWPMTTWLTPDGKPFFGGTYFPARDGDRGAGKGFLTLLGELHREYLAQPDRIGQRAAQISARIRDLMRPAAGSERLSDEIVTSALERYASMFDREHGGLRRAPKFPSSLPVSLLLRHYAQSADARYLEMATLSLQKMAAGGIHDQLGGGFHRYSTDARWLVPHFEKMLYDNALLGSAYLDGFQATGREDFAAVARGLLRYVEREMTSPGGAFYSATDADSPTPSGEREEGLFFTWTPEEIGRVLGAEDAALFNDYYGVSDRGDLDGRSILRVTRSIDQVASARGQSPSELTSRLAAARDKLYRARLARPAPLRDDKVLASWNGLMISAFARGSFVLDDPRLLAVARKAAAFLLDELVVDGRLRRSFMEGQLSPDAFLDDYAFVIAALLDLYEASFESRWLGEAIRLQKQLDARFLDSSDGGYFLTSDDHEPLLAKQKPAHDGAEPSGNSVALMNLVRLHELTSNDRYRVLADRVIAAFGGLVQRNPTGFSAMLEALEFRRSGVKEIVIVTAARREQAAPFLSALRSRFFPNKVLVVAVQGADLAMQRKWIPMLEGKVARKGRTTAYVCESGSCALPTDEVEVFLSQLQRSPRGGSRQDEVP